MSANKWKRYLIIVVLAIAIAMMWTAAASADVSPSSAPSPPDWISAGMGANYDMVRVDWGYDTHLYGRYYKVFRRTEPGGMVTYLGIGEEAYTNGWYEDRDVDLNHHYFYWVQACLVGDCGAEGTESNPGWVAQLPAPTNVNASAENTANVHVAWHAVPLATGYKIFRSVEALGPFLFDGSQDAGITSYIDLDPIPGHQYFYKVRAINDIGWGEYSGAVGGRRRLVAPKGVQASDGTELDHVRVSWNAVEGEVDRYVVLRSLSMAGPYSSIGSTSELLFFDESGDQRIRHYKVKACADQTSACSVESNSDAGALAPDFAPPANVQASDGDYLDWVRITWDVRSEASYYEVWRSGSPSGPETWLGDTPTEAFTTYDDYAPGRGPENTYYYFVRSCGYNYCGSSYGIGDSGYRAGPPPTPQNVNASDGTPGLVEVTWDASPGANVYHVYRHSANSSDQAVLVGSTSGASFVDDDTPGCMTSYYWVRAANAAGFSAFSLPDTGYASGCGGGSSTPTPTLTLIPTQQPPTPTATSVVTKPSVTATATKQFPDTATPTTPPQATATRTATATLTQELTPTKTNTPRDTATPTSTMTPRDTPTATATRRLRDTATPTNTLRPRPSPTPSMTRIPAPRPPTDITASRGTYEDKVRVKWTASNGATYYWILRASLVGGAKTKLAKVRDIGYDDTSAWPGTVYAYWVQACSNVACGDHADYVRGYRGGRLVPSSRVNLPMIFRAP